MLTQQEILEAITTQLSVEVWPIAGQALGYKTARAANDAAKRDGIPTIATGLRRKRVPTVWLRKVLMIEGISAAQAGEPAEAG